MKPIENLSIIVAMTGNRAIGKGNGFPWPRLKGDLKNFQNITSGNALMMGRKTYESIGKPLPDRNNIVLSSKDDFSASGIYEFNDLQKALDYAQSLGKRIYSIGGSHVYSQTIDLASELLISHVKEEYEGDVFFPEYDKSRWQEFDSMEFDQFIFK